MRYSGYLLLAAGLLVGAFAAGIIVGRAMPDERSAGHAANDTSPLSSFIPENGVVLARQVWPPDVPVWIRIFPRPEWRGPRERELRVLHDGVQVASLPLLSAGTVPLPMRVWQAGRWTCELPPGASSIQIDLVELDGTHIASEVDHLPTRFDPDALPALSADDPRAAAIEGSIRVRPHSQHAVLLTLPAMEAEGMREVALGLELEFLAGGEIIGTAECWRHEWALGDPQEYPVMVHWSGEQGLATRVRVRGSRRLSLREFSPEVIRNVYWAGEVVHEWPP